ncbi:MAG: spermidine synthase [Nesterenkonia sp.]
MQLPQSVRLSHSGMLAELTADDLTDSGVVLSIGEPQIGMAEQSHVEVDDPTFLLHDYVRRMRSVLTTTAMTTTAQTTTTQGLFGRAGPETALHLGAGALTLPRWMEQRWPDISQTVVDHEPELVEFVLKHLPMCSAVESLVADAAEVLEGALAQRAFDVVVIDLYNSEQAPQQLTSAAFFRRVHQLIRPGGLMLMNFGDDADMLFARNLISTLVSAVDATAGSALLTAPDPVLAGQEEGNLVFAAVRGQRFTPEQLQQIWAAGPHPGEVLSGSALTSWSG